MFATIPFSRINAYFTSPSCDLFLTSREKNRSHTYTISTYSYYGDILVFFLQRIVAEQLYLLELLDMLLVQARTNPSLSHAHSQLSYQPNSHHLMFVDASTVLPTGTAPLGLTVPNPNIGELSFILTVFGLLTYICGTYWVALNVSEMFNHIQHTDNRSMIQISLGRGVTHCKTASPVLFAITVEGGPRK